MCSMKSSIGYLKCRARPRSSRCHAAMVWRRSTTRCQSERRWYFRTTTSKFELTSSSGHSAILGNTGSGKSCTVATLLQSLFEKRDEFVARGATFLLLDVNGEYRSAFSDLPGTVKRRYLKLEADPTSAAVAPENEGETTAVFRLPHWFMSVEEWELLLRASERTQQPVLRSALGLVTLFSADGGDQAALETLKNHILAKCLLHVLNSSESPSAKGDRVKALLATFQTEALTFQELGPLALMLVTAR